MARPDQRELMETLISDIRNKIDNLVIQGASREFLSALLSAINDWPESVSSLEEYEIKVKLFLNKEVTSANLKSALENIDWTIDAWRGESITQLMELMERHDASRTLKDLISELRTKI